MNQRNIILPLDVFPNSLYFQRDWNKHYFLKLCNLFETKQNSEFPNFVLTYSADKQVTVHYACKLEVYVS